MVNIDIDEYQKASASTLWSVAQQMTIGMDIALGAMALRDCQQTSARSGIGVGAMV